MIVGECPSKDDAAAGAVFTGTAGWLLDHMLSEAGIARRECALTNVFSFPFRDIKELCGPKTLGIKGLPPVVAGKYVTTEYAGELERLYGEIAKASPNLIIAMGATAVWALLHSSGIKSVRGSCAQTPAALDDRLGRPFKVLPTYHPSAVSRQWNLRPIVISDLDKARRNSAHPHYVRPERHIWIEPTLEDLDEYDRKFIEPCELLSADIETRQEQITCIGFAPSEHSAIVIPFFAESGANYWATKTEELAAWHYVRKWLAEKPTLFQNGLYDINFLWSRYGIPVPLAAEDTMLLHHAFQPEMEKGLGFLATIYTEEASWKFMRKGMKHD